MLHPAPGSVEQCGSVGFGSLAEVHSAADYSAQPPLSTTHLTHDQVNGLTSGHHFAPTSRLALAVRGSLVVGT
ncbi:hypothetical protein GCM10009759_77450 [Kitasatospora saccharophila]|uniref:Uncharacterized protein n=1 Tax=Kitasatospora saccharophila TaxID=407973 RepID=A0ABP5K0I9_9ACTN